MEPYKGALAVLAAALLYGSYGVWAVLIGEEFDIFFLSYSRACIVLLLIVPAVWFFAGWKKVSTGDYTTLAVVSVLGVLTQAPAYYAYQVAGVGIASLFFFVAYLVSQYLLGALVFKEQIGWVRSISFVIAVAGAYLIFVHDIQSFALLAVLMAVLAGGASGSQVALTKLLSNKYTSLQLSVYTWSAVVLSAFPLSLLLGETQHVPTLTLSWLYVVLFAVAGLLTFVFVVYGYKRIDASVGGLIGLVEIVAAVWFGWAFFNELISATIVAGSLLILFAAVLPDLHTMLRRRT